MIRVPMSDKRSDNKRRFPCHDDEQPCIICGRPVKHGGGGGAVHLVEGGDCLVRINEPYDNDAADLGEYPIGADCLRKHPELRPYVYGPY